MVGIEAPIPEFKKYLVNLYYPTDAGEGKAFIENYVRPSCFLLFFKIEIQETPCLQTIYIYINFVSGNVRL